MAFRRKATKRLRRLVFRRRSKRVSRFRGRRFRGRRSFKARSNSATTIARKYTQVSCNRATGDFQSLAFSLVTCLDPSELGAWKELYDLYSIKGVSVRFVPKANTLSVLDLGAAASNGVIPEIITAIDLDDATIPTSIADLLEYGTFRRQRFTRDHKRYFVPRGQTMVYNGLASTAYGLMPKRQWLDMSNDSVPLYGIKWIVTPSTYDPTSPYQFYYDMYVTTYIAFKNKV